MNHSNSVTLVTLNLNRPKNSLPTSSLFTIYISWLISKIVLQQHKACITSLLV